MAGYSTPNLTGINVNFYEFEISLKPVGEPICGLPEHLHAIRQIIFFVLKVKKPLIFGFGSLTSKLSRYYKNFLQNSHLLLHFSIEQLFYFIVLGNKDGDMISFKFLFRLCVTLTVFSRKL